MKGNRYQEKAFRSRDDAFPLYSLSWKYDIVQTAMFEADTTALSTLVPLGFIKRGDRTELADDDARIC